MLKRVLAIALIVIIAITFIVALRPVSNYPSSKGSSGVYVGVTFSGNTTVEAKLLIDKVKSYTNLLVVDSGPISKNETSLNEICDYATSQDLHIMAYFGKLEFPWQKTWINSAKEQWGSNFVGIYFFDEPAGSLLDNPQEILAFYQPQNYDEMANLFVESWRTMPGLATVKALPSAPTTFTSDYALYWWDFKGGYTVVLSEFGWNNSREQQIALVRGAATVQNKTWGAIVTWTYTDGAYLESGTQLYDDMVLAYNNGAKYIVVFNYPAIEGNPYGILTEDHFDALQRFWNKIQQQPNDDSYSAQNVLVLPRNYGWGMRNSNDKIWGLWGPDYRSPQIWNATENTLSRYFPNIDIVYEDSDFSVGDHYSNIIYWNSTSP
jgi:hypothetical protein